MLFRAPSLDETERGVVRQIEDLKEKLRWRLHEPRRWVGSLRRLSFARNIQLSALGGAGRVPAGGPTAVHRPRARLIRTVTRRYRLTGRCRWVPGRPGTWSTIDGVAQRRPAR